MTHAAATGEWKKIPGDTDVLLTHGPPYDILDRTERGHNVGCNALRTWITTNQQTKGKPLVHVFGHVHEAHGETELGGTRFFNVAQTPVKFTVKVPLTTAQQ
eukprot:TRINITY_DN4855_c0_g1_i2.p2 TRINITY_DN4855_c0_g1~~TRINITY_DN4855_c0_g1_i2.p2  ORF type:complete len:102 (-),score=31.31 TRINITY_DN4855_c0_g1_i2:16-321(-)